MSKTLVTTKAIFCFSMFWWGLGVFAQTINGYVSISTAQGLSQGMVFDILQDKEGFIWVGTKNGLNRYDGYGFKVFTNDPYNINSLSSNTVMSLFEDSKGRIWVGTDNAGLNVYDKKTGKFHRIAHDPKDAASLSGNRIRLNITEMPDGRMLVPAEEAGINIIQLPGNFFEKITPPLITRLSLPANSQVRNLGIDSTGKIWIGCLDKKVYGFNPLKNSFTLLPAGKLCNNGFINADGVWVNDKTFLWDGEHLNLLFDPGKAGLGNIIMTPRDKLWLGFYGTLADYDISRLQPGKPIKWGEELALATASKTVLYPFMVDRSGIMWAGTMGYGLRKYNASQGRFHHLTPGFSVRFIVPYRGNDIFLGAYPYDWRRLTNDSLEKNVFAKISSNNKIDNVIISKTGDYWIWTDDEGLFNYNNATRKLTAFPGIINYGGDKQPMFEDSKGYIWLASLNGSLTRVTPSTGKTDAFSININPAKPMLAKSHSTAFYEDGKGVYWMGTEEGFAKIIFAVGENEKPEITWFRNNPADRNSLNYEHVSCFLDDPKDPGKYLWICTKGGGLNRLDKITGDFFHLTVKDGLPNDVVYGILPDDAGNIWGSTNRGIFCLIPTGNKADNHWSFRNFTKGDGLQDDEFNTGAFARLPNGKLAFGGVNGVNIFNPKEILVPGFVPDVFITSIMVNNLRVEPGDEGGVLQNTIEQTQHITLSHLQDILTLEFASLDFTTPGQNKYRYKLEGADKEWVESGNRRTATYLHLSPGNYTFNVQGSNSQGIWSNKIAELQIKVLPPWWRTWSAWLVYLLIIVLSVRAYFKFTINRARLKSQVIYEQKEANRVRELNTAKTQLYTNITHEFRTPLTVILGMARQVLNDPARHFQNGMDMIIRNGQSLLKLVNELLDLSKLESGKMSLQLVQGDIISFVRYIVESFQSLAESQNKQLHYLSELDSLPMSYDPEKMRQIFSNLLSNALKFTPRHGNIYISISEANGSKQSGKSSLIIKVKDTGMGIPENKQQHIFDRFYQLDNSNTRMAEGTGIGLALTKELVKLMEGEILVKSPPAGSGTGTEFTVVLPFNRLVDEDMFIIPHSYNAHNHIIQPVIQNKYLIDDKSPSIEKPLILLVEDNADVVAYTASCLPEYRLAVGKDGREGLEIASDMIPDLIITDVMMPFIDGFELCSKLRNDERTSHIPIIMLTAKADMDSKMQGLERGADVYLEKPFNREELLMRIKKLLELRKNLRQHYLKKAGLSDNPVPASVSADLAQLTGDDRIEDVFVQKVREAIDAHLMDFDFTVEQLCKYIFMSHSQLHRKLEALTGYSPSKFIRMIRLNKAKELLKNPETGIGTIALDCGYNDPGYFSRIFKQENGITPQEWRARYKTVSL